MAADDVANRDEIRLIRLPRGESVAFRPDDPKSVDLLARLHRSQRREVRLGLGVLRRSATAGRVLSAASFNSDASQTVAEDLLNAVRTLLDEKFESVAFNIAPDLSRATVALFDTNGRTIFVKARRVDDTRLADMAAFLREFRPRCPATVVIPEVLNVGAIGGWNMVALSDVGSTQPTGGIPALGELIPYLHAIRSTSAEAVDPSDALDILSRTLPECPAITADLMAALRGTNAAGTMCLSQAHGDFVPWNMWLRSNRLQLWDWDKSIARAPWPYDAVHYAFQTRRCCRHIGRGEALSGAMAEIALHAGALRVPGVDDDVRRQFAFYAVCRSIAERRLGRNSTDGEWLVREFNALLR